MKKLAALAILIIVHGNAYAGTGSGTVSRILVNSDSGGAVAMFRTSGNTNKAACSGAHNGTEWAFRLNDDKGRAMYSLLLAINAQGKNVSVIGTGLCDAWADRETPRYLYIDD